MTRIKSAGDDPSREEGFIENPASVPAPRAGASIGHIRSALAGSRGNLRRHDLQAALDVMPLEQEPSEGVDAPNMETADKLSQWLSDRKFYDQYLCVLLEARHPGASLFALYFPPSSIVREDAAQGGNHPSSAIFATGEALISIPAKTRRGAPTVADLTVPVRVRGHIEDGLFAFDEAYFVPQSAYFPPLVPDRVTRPRRVAQR